MIFSVQRHSTIFSPSTLHLISLTHTPWISSSVLLARATPERVQQFNEQHGLDAPLWVQYGRYWAGAVTGDLGTSWRDGQPVASVLATRLPRTMLLGGLFILAFVVVHLLDLTIGQVLAPGSHRHAEADGTIHAYHNLVESFSRPWMAAFYVVSMLVIAMHIWHGWRTVLQDVGATGRRLRAVWATLGALIAWAIVLGNALIPVLVQLGAIA